MRMYASSSPTSIDHHEVIWASSCSPSDVTLMNSKSLNSSKGLNLNWKYSENVWNAQRLTKLTHDISKVKTSHSILAIVCFELVLGCICTFNCCQDCPSCPTHLNSTGWATWAVWAAIKKYSLTAKQYLQRLH